MQNASVDAKDIDAIVGGYHSDAFSVLGPHAIKRDWAGDGWEVRAFLPHAAQAELIIGKTLVAPMDRVHPAGFFVARLDAKPDSYRFRISADDRAWEEEDPYRFPLLLTAFELHLHGEGTHYEAYNMLGAHFAEYEGVSGVRFAVWAPNAESVSVTGDFNGWDVNRNPMRHRDGGVWEIFLPQAHEGDVYKFWIRSKFLGYRELKCDPFAFACEHPPRTGSVVTRRDSYEWKDAAWIEKRGSTDWINAPVSVYEVHLGSWMLGPGGRVLTYRELALKLVAYVAEMGYTHIELMPVLEHPLTASWGYQVTGYFAPTSRFGSPDDFKHLVDQCHAAGIGVLLDWVPAHFPRDAHGLAYFDGTHLYEHEDPRLGEHRDWGTKIFNFGRNEVRGFLISSALWWLKEYHLDGLRVDAVASMLYLDYSRKEGEWVPNRYGGRENLEAIDFIKRFNEQLHLVPGAISVAEESTAFPGVSRPVYANGLGFTFKWNMGWMHDMLDYISRDPVYRMFHHHNLTFSMLYAFSENYVLPISHDEVVHGKRSLMSKMPGDEWRRFANARSFLAYMYGHPGKKLLFMGCELGQYEEWNFEASLRWDLLQYDYHRKLQALARELNHLYREHPALYEMDNHYSGFEWVDFRDVNNSIIAFLRWSKDRRECMLFICNFTPIPRQGYKMGVPKGGMWREVLNTDAEMFGGSNMGNAGLVRAYPEASHGRDQHISITVPPLGVMAFVPQPAESADDDAAAI
ncbi:MAG: 1,4-alpha-glucan branching protein GlgB [Bryobacteraceae bacterium]